MLGKLQTYKLQPAKFYEKGYRAVTFELGRCTPLPLMIEDFC